MRWHLLAAGLWLGLLSGPANAGFVVSIIDPAPVAPGGSGYFDVILTNSPDTAPVQDFRLTGYNIHLSVTTAGVSFTDVTAASPDYVYVFADPDIGGLGILATPSGNVVDWTDQVDTFQTMKTGDVFLLGRVLFDFSTDTPGSYPIQIDKELSFFSQFPLSGEGVPNIPFDTNDGTLTVTGSVVTPEPSSLALLLIGTGGMALARRFRRGEAPRPAAT